VSAPTTRPFFGQPFGWLVLAVALAMVPLGAALAQTGWTWTRMHPAVNAILNGTSAVFVIAGGIAIKRRAIDFHRRCMLAAVGCSAVFLVSYLIRFATTGAHRYPGTGAAKTVYLIILGTHTVLAAIALPLGAAGAVAGADRSGRSPPPAGALGLSGVALRRSHRRRRVPHALSLRVARIWSASARAGPCGARTIRS
jgi:uncharacterized membrane protein YozB (DUF420 family)